MVSLEQEMMDSAAMERDRTWTDKEVWQAIAEGQQDNHIFTNLGTSPGTTNTLRRFYLMAEVEQVHNIVLKDGRVIPLTEKQSRQVSMIILASTRVSKKILIRGYEPAFALSDIVTDPEEILRLTQVEFDLGKIERPKVQKNTDIG